MTFVDSNIPMYLVGAPHPHKVDAQRLMDRSIAERTRLVTDAEVLQEILHRYRAINRMDAVKPAFDLLLTVVDETYPIESHDVEQARVLLTSTGKISSRDALHLAIMRRNGIRRILSFDSGFDGIPGLQRVFQ
jgi:predicted nucleic acid-binding protein